MEEAGDDPPYISAFLGDIARTRGTHHLEEKTGITRGGLYYVLSPDGSPSFETILQVTKGDEGARTRGEDQQGGRVMTTRGERIAQKRRNRARWRRVFRWHSWSSAEWIECSAVRAAEHGKLCSCEMCGNPRRYFGDETLQERRAALALDRREQEVV